MNNNMEKEIFDIYVDDIIPNRFQPRLTFDEKALNELSDSIKQHGIIQPLVVRKIGDKYEIIAGERRYKAAQIAGLQKVPCVIMNLNDNESAEVAVIENIQRRDLTALEEAESYKKLLDKGYLTQEQLAGRMGKAQATISNKLRLLGLDDEVKDALLNEKISERHARSLLSLKNPEDQKHVLNKIITNKLTVRQTDDLIRSMTGDSVETLDFQNTVASENPPVTPSPIITPPEVPIQTPAITNVEPIIEPVTSPIPTINSDENNQPNFDPISNIDIDKMREKSFDINPEKPLADVNALLGIKSAPENPPVNTQINDVPKARFITSLEDEETNMDMQDPVATTLNEFTSNNEPPILAPIPEEPTNIVDQPKTYTDSLVQEFRQNNGIMADMTGNNVTPGDLRSAINAFRDLSKTLERNNFKVDVEEFDFEHLYQIIIKIDKE
jgi:ParB family chromosome partitioning protein